MWKDATNERPNHNTGKLVLSIRQTDYLVICKGGLECTPVKCWYETETDTFVSLESINYVAVDAAYWMEMPQLPEEFLKKERTWMRKQKHL